MCSSIGRSGRSGPTSAASGDDRPPAGGGSVPVNPEGRDALDIDALRTDRYLESLLAAQERGAWTVPADSSLDPGIRDAAGRLARDLVRVHPSFRFEERLARRLAEMGRGMRLAPAAGGGGAIPLPFPLPSDRLSHPDPYDLDDDADPRDLRPYLIGGALTSAALSLAGAAWVAWRRVHAAPRHVSPMVRAARVARHARFARRLS